MDKFGSLPPPEIEWQIGKTAASIQFVIDAERFIQTCQDPRRVDLLNTAIKKIRDGTLVLQNWLTPEEYFNQITS